MTQTATVTALPAAPGGLVELTVVRQTACGHSCDGCGRCAALGPAVAEDRRGQPQQEPRPAAGVPPGLRQRSRQTVVRQTACGHSCDGCGRCAGRSPDLVIQAESGVPVALGDRVEVYSDNKVLGFGWPGAGWSHRC